MQLAQVIIRLKAEVGALRSVEGAASLATLLQGQALPQHTPAAHVVPLGLRGGRVDAAAGAFTQIVEEVFGVVLTLRSNSQTGARDLPDIDGLIRDVIEALAGWGPADAIDVLALQRGALISMTAGTIIYQLDFAMTDQVRIFS